MVIIMKLIELDIEKYDDYVRNHKEKSHFLQSAAWGLLAKQKKNLEKDMVKIIYENFERNL